MELCAHWSEVDANVSSIDRFAYETIKREHVLVHTYKKNVFGLFLISSITSVVLWPAAAMVARILEHSERGLIKP